MNIIDKIRAAVGHLLQEMGGWMAKEEKQVIEFLHKVNPIVQAADGYIKTLDGFVGDYTKMLTANGMPTPALVTLVKGWLDTAVVDGAKVEAWLTTNIDVPGHTLLENAVVLAVENAPAGLKAKLNEIKTAVNFAVSIERQKQLAAVANEG